MVAAEHPWLGCPAAPLISRGEQQHLRAPEKPCPAGGGTPQPPSGHAETLTVWTETIIFCLFICIIIIIFTIRDDVDDSKG